MYLDKLEPSSVEEFQFLKDQLSKYYPDLEKLEWKPGEVLSQIAKLTGIPKAQFEKEILSISREAVDKNQKMTLMLFRLGLNRSAEQLERMTGIPMRDLESQHLMKMRVAWFCSSITELLVHIGIFVGIFFVFHPLVANILIFGYCLFQLWRNIRGHGSPISNRIVTFVMSIIGEGDKRWRI